MLKVKNVNTVDAHCKTNCLNIFKLIPCFYLPILIFIVNKFVISPFGVYARWGWFDIPMHIIGGCAIAYSFILVLRKVDDVVITNRFFEIIIIIGLLSTVAIFWEFYEYLMHIIINVDQNTLRDTLSDFLFGLLGGMLITLNIKVKRCVTTNK